MTTIVVTIPTKTLKTIDRWAATAPHEGPRNTLGSTTPNLPDIARRSIVDRGHVTPETGGTTGEGGGTGTGTETVIVTEIVQVSAEVANTRKRIRRRRRRNEERVLVVAPDRATKRINSIQTFSWEK